MLCDNFFSEEYEITAPLQYILCCLLNLPRIKMTIFDQDLGLVAKGLDLSVVNLDISLHSLVFLEEELDTGQVMAQIFKGHQCFNFIHPNLVKYW